MTSRAGRVVTFYATLTGAAVLWGALRGHPNILLCEGPTLRPGDHAAQFLSSGAIGVAMGLMLVLLTRLLQERYAWARTLHNEFHDLLSPLSEREILLIAAASAIGEECLFRGALLLHLKALVPGVGGYLLSIFGSAAIFALLHIGPGVRFLPWTLSALLMGLLLGVVFVGMGDLLGAIAIHFTVNLLNLKDIVRRQIPA